MIRTSDKIFIPFMALDLEEDAPPDMGGGYALLATWGEGDPGCGLSFFFIIKSQFPL